MTHPQHHPDQDLEALAVRCRSLANALIVLRQGVTWRRQGHCQRSIRGAVADALEQAADAIAALRARKASR